MKPFILLGNKQAAGGKVIWPYVKRGIVNYGYTSPKKFSTPDGSETKKLAGLSRWYTNLPVEKNTALPLTKSYYADPSRYPKYDGYDAIEVGRVKDIPYDYWGQIGVPITYLDHQHPDFEILGITGGQYSTITEDVLSHQLRVNGKTKTTRILIKRKCHEQTSAQARKAKNDEYYTLYSDVAAELVRHKNRLKGQRIHCPFSDYRTSEVVRFLTDYFWVLGLSHLTATCLDRGDGAWRYDYDGKTVTITRLSGNGSFDSPEVTAIMRSSNVIIDNPPFSKWGAIIKWTKVG